MTKTRAHALEMTLKRERQDLHIGGIFRLPSTLLWAVAILDRRTGRHYTANSLEHWTDYVAPEIERARTGMVWPPQ